MPHTLPRSRFTAWNIAAVPDVPGAYLLWQGEELVYVGRALQGLRERITEHYTRRARPWDATHFGWDACPRPDGRERELLEGARRRYGRLPRFNASA